MSTDQWKVICANTGLETLTAGRIQKIKQYIGDDEEFMKLLKSENLDKLVHIKEKSEKSQNQGANIQLNEHNS